MTLRRLLPLLFFVAATAHGASLSPLEGPARRFLRNFEAGRFDAAVRDFNDQMRASVTPAYLADLKRQIDAQLGVFLTVTEVRQGRGDDGLRLVELIARYAKGSASMRITFDDRDRIASVHLNPIVPATADPKLEAAARALLADFNVGHLDAVRGRFDPAMQAQLTPARLSDLARQVAVAWGAFLSVTSVNYGAGKEQSTVELIALYENGPMSFRVTFDRAGRVAGLKIAKAPKR